MTFGRRSRETAPPPIPSLPDEYREPSPIEPEVETLTLTPAQQARKQAAVDSQAPERRILALNHQTSQVRKAIERILALSPGASIVLSGAECKAIRDSLQSG